MIQSILVIAFILLAFEIIFIMNEFKNKYAVTVIQQYVYISQLRIKLTNFRI